MRNVLNRLREVAWVAVLAGALLVAGVIFGALGTVFVVWSFLALAGVLVTAGVGFAVIGLRS